MCSFFGVWLRSRVGGEKGGGLACLLTEERGEDHDETSSQVDIDGLDVGDFGEGRVSRGHEGCHGEHSGYSEGDPSGGCVSV